MDSPGELRKVQVVGPNNSSGIWRRERIRMTEAELDDVAFLTGIIRERLVFMREIHVELMKKQI